MRYETVVEVRSSLADIIAVLEGREPEPRTAREDEPADGPNLRLALGESKRPRPTGR